jgi:hypothetical protein
VTSGTVAERSTQACLMHAGAMHVYRLLGASTRTIAAPVASAPSLFSSMFSRKPHPQRPHRWSSQASRVVSHLSTVDPHLEYCTTGVGVTHTALWSRCGWCDPATLPCCPCRWFNQGPNSRLLFLPPNALQTIARKAGAGRQCRLACTALRHAYNTPGSAILLHIGQDPVPEGTPQMTTGADRSTALLDARITGWPFPHGVTRLEAIRPLSQSTCAAITHTLPNLRHLALASGCMQGAHTALSPHITSLEMCLATPNLRASWDLGGVAHFTALQSLSLTGCGCCATYRHDLGVLTNLAELTSLSFEMDAGRYGGVPTGSYFRDVTPGGLAVWKTLAAIPRLARLSLRVPLNYHTPMLEVAPMTALTHLGLWCDLTMVDRDVRLAVEVPARAAGAAAGAEPGEPPSVGCWLCGNQCWPQPQIVSPGGCLCGRGMRTDTFSNRRSAIRLDPYNHCNMQPWQCMISSEQRVL